MRFACDSCSAQYMISDEKVGPNGVKVRCKKCGHVILVKRAPEQPEQVEAAPAGPVPPPVEAEVPEDLVAEGVVLLGIIVGQEDHLGPREIIDVRDRDASALTLPADALNLNRPQDIDGPPTSSDGPGKTLQNIFDGIAGFFAGPEQSQEVVNRLVDRLAAEFRRIRRAGARWGPRSPWSLLLGPRAGTPGHRRI